MSILSLLYVVLFRQTSQVQSKVRIIIKVGIVNKLMSFRPTFMCEMLLKGSKEILTVSNALNTMYVKGVESGVCCFYTTLYTECRFNFKGVKSVLCIQGPSLH